MARTPLAKVLKQLIQLAGQNKISPEILVEMRAEAQFSRRQALKNAVGLTAAVTLSQLASKEAMAQEIIRSLKSRSKDHRHVASIVGPVIIIGAGTAGLTAAYRLSHAGVPCVIYEAAARTGGRMFTQHSFNSDGMFCERGGELVDSNHDELIGLCKEVGLEIQSLAETDSTLNNELYFVNGKVYKISDLLNAFQPLAAQIVRDKKNIFGTNEGDSLTYRTPFNSLAFDRMNIKEYLESKKGVDRWVLDLVNVCYTGEYGLEADQQSSLNLISMISSTDDEVKLLGESDESKRIKGGNGGLPQKLTDLLKSTVPIHSEHELVKISDDGMNLNLVFNHNGKTVEVRASQVISAIPFTVLRHVEGVKNLDLSPRKKKCIAELGYGTNSKLITGYRTKVWRTLDIDRKSNGLAYTTTSSQEFWETSRKQNGQSGIITNFMGGNAGKNASLNHLDRTLNDLDKVFPGTKQQFDGNKVLQHWPSYRFTQGSYICPMPGQYNEIMGSAEEPELNNRLCFAGEHTSVSSGGFMNGAVSSGNRVAKDILASRGIVAKVKKTAGS